MGKSRIPLPASPPGALPPEERPARTGRAALWLAVAGLVAAGAIVYAGSLQGPFVFLDQAAIRDNPTLHRLWPLSAVLHPPHDRGITVEGRPLVNLTFAVNYAISGTGVWSYHLVNILFHLLAGLTLFGIVRRTLVRLGDGQALLCAWLIALLWVVHPLETESVTYTVQRAESLMGLFYLSTLYGLIRAADEPGPWEKVWFAYAWGVCLLGMACKEVMVTAPVMVFIYDAIFLSGSVRAAIARRWAFYAALLLTWIPLALFVASTGGNRGGTSGFGLGVSLWAYLLTQCVALVHYLRLALWPQPLIFYYEVHWVSAAQVVPEGLAVLAMLGLGGWLLWRRPKVGFLFLWFFAILAPTSLIPGLSQTIAEHRMYLSLAAVLTALVIAIRALARHRGVWAGAIVALACVYGALTMARNRVYASEVGLWQDTVRKAPGNPYSLNNLGIALSAAGFKADAISDFQDALAIDPKYASARDNLGLAYAETGQTEAAVREYLKAIAAEPELEEPWINLGMSLLRMGQPYEAIRRFQKASELAPADPSPLIDLAGAEMALGRTEAAVGHYEKALSLAPMNGQSWFDLGNACAQLGRWPEALHAYENACKGLPLSSDAQANRGAALANLGRMPEAIDAYHRALAIAPNDADVHTNLAQALRALGRTGEAKAEEHWVASGGHAP